MFEQMGSLTRALVGMGRGGKIQVISMTSIPSKVQKSLVWSHYNR